MRKNGRHPIPGGRVRSRPLRPDGFRPLSLVPPLPAEPPVDDTPESECTCPPGEPGYTPAEAQARAQEIADALAARQRRLSGEQPEPTARRWSDAPPPPSEPRIVRPGRRREVEMSPALQMALRGINQQFLDSLIVRWGGVDALDQLDTEPLPDEPFDWAAVPAEHRERVEKILGLVDDTCDTWFDQEHRTACRRLLARVAGEPWVINRRGKVETIAGALVWTIASFNGTTGRRRRLGVVPATWIAHHLGLASGSAFATRSIDIRIAAGIHLHRNGPEPVGEPGLIVSRKRRHAARMRDRHRAELA